MLNTRGRKRFVRRLTYYVPRWHWAYRVCKMYVDNFRGDNNADHTINGESHLLRRFLPSMESCIVFDVGANRGQWCKQVLHIKPLAQIHCFEPSSQAFEKLVTNNFPSNVICNNVALGSQAVEATLYVDDGFSELSSLHIHNQERTMTPEIVQIETLSGYCLDHGLSQISFIKIDVEGHELEVLKGAVSLFADRAVAAVQFEYGATYISSRTLLKDVFELMRDFDYDFYKILPFSLLPIPKYGTHLETFESSNYLMLLRNSL